MNFLFRVSHIICFVFFLQTNVFSQSLPTYLPASEEIWMPHQFIRTLFQDSHGNIWAGTNAGLHKYNLNTVTNYNLTKKATNRLLNNTVHCINEDNFGNILVGTESGLGILNPNNGEVKVASESDETVTEIIRGHKGIIWVITNASKVFKLITTQNILTQGISYNLMTDGQTLNSPVTIKTLLELPDGRLLIGAAEGLFLYDTVIKKMQSANFHYNINALHTTDNITFWAGTTTNGLFKLTLQKEDQLSASISSNIQIGIANTSFKNYITTIKPLEDNKLAIATPGEVFIINNNTSIPPLHISSNLSFKESSIAGLMIDGTGNIWINSRKGMYKIKKQTLSAQYISPDIKEFRQDNFITSLLTTKTDEIWLLTNNNGIFRYNTKTGLQQKIDLGFKNYHVAKKSAAGDIILVADDKIILIPAAAISSNKPTYTLLAKGQSNTQISDLSEVAPGEWWACSWKYGLLRFTANNQNSATENLYQFAAKQFSAQSHLFTIEKDINDNIWIGTRGEGVLKINLKNKAVTRYNKQSKLSDRILAIEEDSKGRVWIGTRGDGLHLYNAATDNFINFDEKDGLPSNSICAIEENNQKEIWVSTMNGISCMQENQFIPFRSFNYTDGLSISEFSFNTSAADFDGFVYFGSGSGMYKIKKTAVNEAAVVPVIWTSIELLKTSSKKNALSSETADAANSNIVHSIENNNLTLSHDQNNISIGFAALDFTTPEKNMYAYRLTGKDENWKIVYGPKQNIQFLNLPAGKYIFEVKYCNNYGQWSPTSSLSIVINPSFWSTGTAYILYALLVITAALVFWFLRKRWYRLNRQLEKEIESSQMHNRQMIFYTDLSHEIKNRLSLLLGPLEDALKGKKVNQQVLNTLYEQGLRLKKLTDQIMDIRRSESGEFLLNVGEENIKSTIQQIVNEATPLAVVKNISITLVNQKENISGWCDEEILEIIVMNLLNNAIKYCKANGKVEIKTDSQYLGGADLPGENLKEGNYLCCTITDNGVGISKSEISKILTPFYRAENIRYNKKDTPGTGIGLNLVARLIKKHHGYFDIRSELNEFTSVSFYLPVDKSAYSIAELKPNIVHAPIIIPGEKPEYHNHEKLILPEKDFLPVAALPKKEWAVLIVDDNEEILKFLEQTLAAEFTVYKAADGQKALSILDTADVHLIISDLDMPVMDGLALCNRVKTSDRLKNIPFLILTGRNSEEQKLICFQNAVDDFIEKPFSPELLKWKVKSFLRSSAAKVKLKTVMVVEPKEEIKESEEDKFIQSIINLIEKNIDKDYLDVDFLAENMFSSRATFYRRMEQMVGESPSVFIRKYRLKKAALYLQSGNYSVNEVSSKTGFSNPKYFSKCFQKEFGMLPSEYIDSNITDSQKN